MSANGSPDEVLVVLCSTDGAESAARMARELLDGRLVACVNVVAGVRSFYRWKGEIAEDGEHLMVIKTRQVLFEQVRNCIRGLHPYDLPEIIAVPLAAGDGAYLDWVRECTSEVTD